MGPGSFILPWEVTRRFSVLVQLGLGIHVHAFLFIYLLNINPSQALYFCATSSRTNQHTTGVRTDSCIALIRHYSFFFHVDKLFIRCFHELSKQIIFLTFNKPGYNYRLMKCLCTEFQTLILHTVTHSSPRCFKPPQPCISQWRPCAPQSSGLIAAGN